MKLKNMKFVTLLAVGGLLTVGSAAFAQDSTNAPAGNLPPAGGRGMMHGQMIDQLATTLNLTDDQKPKVQAAFEDQAKQIRDLRQDTSLSMEDRRTKMRSIHEATMAKMKDILTEEQFQKFQQMQHNKRNRGPRAGGDNGTNAPATPPAAPPQQ